MRGPAGTILSGGRREAGFANVLKQTALALAPVFAAFFLQLLLWPVISPFAWFLLSPAMFFSAWLGGRRLGIVAAAIATLLLWHFFLPVRGAMIADRPALEVIAALTFFGTGVVFSLFHGRLKRVERKAAEEIASSRYRAQLESAFQAIQDGIVVTDMNGAFLMVNEAEARMSGFSSVDATEQSLDYYRKRIDVLYPDGTVVAFEDWPIQRVLRGESVVNLELRSREKDTGEERIFTYSGEPVRNERGEQFLAVLGMRDITEQKRAEEALRASENQFRTTFENAAVGIATITLDGRFLNVNQRFCDILGYTRPGMLRQTMSGISDPDDQATDTAERRLLLDGTTASLLREKRYVRKDGSVVWVHLSLSLLLKADLSPEHFIAIIEDISSRKEAEERLHNSEERLRLALRAAGLGVFEWNVPVDTAVWENERMYEIFGHTHADGELSKDDLVAHYVHPDDGPALESALLNGMKSGSPFETVYRIRRKDGEQRWLTLSANFDLAHNKAPTRMIGILADITDRVRAEKDLRESESRFRQLAESLPLLVWTCGPDGSCDYLSPQWVAYTGFPERDQLGSGWINQLYPGDRDRAGRAWKQAVANVDPYEVEFRIRRHDRVYRWFKTRAVAQKDAEGKVIKWFGSSTDIENQKQAARELQASKDRLAGIVSSAMDAIITVDEGQVVVLFNEAAERMFGCAALDAIGQTIDRFIPERFRGPRVGRMLRYNEALRKRGAASRLISLSALRGDGVEFPIEAATSSIEVGGRTLYTVILRDITERRQAEGEREQLAAEQARRAAAEAANRSKDEFLALVSHELRSPLSAIFGYTRLLRSRPADREMIVKATAVIERSVKAQLQIIEDLLDSARIVTGKLRIEPKLIDLVPVLDSAVDTVRAAAEARGITIAADYDPLAVETLGDPARLQQVVVNLLTNAVKFTPSGGRIELRMERVGDDIHIVVRDNGLGVAAEFMPFIFDRFRQADPSSVRRAGGLGLGLSLVKHLVELHGGTISAASEGQGKGSTFTVTLRSHPQIIAAQMPTIATSEVRREGALTPDDAQSLEGVSVLVVDDQDEARTALIETLSEFGAQVTAAPSGKEALALLSNPPDGRRPDALVLDIAMPDEDGYTLLRKIRALETAKGEASDPIPAIALTAYGRSEDRLRALQAGFRMHVAKPVEPAELAVVIASVTNRRHRNN
jgi:PAS domain S-box-containing protein